MSTSPVGLPLALPSPVARLGPGLTSGRAPGVLAMLLIAGFASVVAVIEQRLFGQPVVEALVVALVSGVVLRNLLPGSGSALLKAGADLASKHILEVAVGLLGASVAFPELLAAGPALLGFVVGAVVCTILVSFALGRLVGLGEKLALLVAVGNSICGNSAIAATAPVIDADQRDVASAIALTAVIGLCLVLGLPFLIVPFALSHYQYGVLAGMSVYAVPQVVAAAFPVSQLSGEVATLVKLTRVMLLGPIVLLLSCIYAGRRMSHASGVPARNLAAYVPWFVAVFLGLASLRSFGLLPDSLAHQTQELSRLLMIVAMAGLGFGVRLTDVRKVGPRVAAAVLGSLSFIATLTLVVIRVAGIQG